MTKDELADVRAAVLAALVEYESMKKNKRTEAVKKAMRSTIAATALGGAGFSLAHSDRESTRSLYEEHRIGVDLGAPQDAAPVAAPAVEQKVKQAEQKAAEQRQAAEEAKRNKQALADAARQEKAAEAARKKQVEEEARAEKVAEAERKKQAAEQARAQKAAEEQQHKLAAEQAREQHVAELAQRKQAAEQMRAQKAAEEQQHKLAAEQARKEQVAQLEQRKQVAQQAKAEKAAEEQRLKVAAEQARKSHLEELAQQKQAADEVRREQVAEAARRKQAIAEARQERLAEAARLKQAALEAKKLAAAEAAKAVAPAAAVAVATSASSDQGHGQMADAMHREQTIKGAVHFGFGSRNLAMAHKERLDSLVQQLPAGAELTVIGHTDSRGNRNYNYVLGKNRALAVAQYLTDKGVSIKLVGSKGENSGSSGWMARRVDIVLAYNAPEAIQVNLPPVLERHAAKSRADASKVVSLNDAGRVTSKHRHRAAADHHAHLSPALKHNRRSEAAHVAATNYRDESVAVGGGFEEATGGQTSHGLDEKLRVSDGNLAKMRPGSEVVNARGAGAGDNN